MKESDVARAVRDLLNILVAQGRCYYHVSASSPSIGREGLYRKGQVDLAGWVVIFADDSPSNAIVAIEPFAWELKGSKGRLSLAQEGDLAIAHLARASVAVIHNVDEALAALKKMGVEIEIRSE